MVELDTLHQRGQEGHVMVGFLRARRILSVEGRTSGDALAPHLVDVGVLVDRQEVAGAAC